MSDFSLIAGLGNPGPRFAKNRHNIGFQVVEALADAHGLAFSRTEQSALTAHGYIQTTNGAQRIILAKPQTWMNESGRAVTGLARFYKIAPEDILVVYDDLDIPLGTVRYRQAGSSGGHRGVQSTIQHMGNQDFPRLRLGIGRPPGKMDPAAYVLQDFSAAEQPITWEVQRLARDLILAWLNHAPDLQRQGMTWRVENVTDSAKEKV
ncbi:MAG: aminoacyl-tRNA hydrolase [Anaerolineae bacterium]|nr:aminoacyl-tRNA hydrolase [Anaerolineae bacterium]